ncbi:hypothetical protein LTR37_018039 [Vermiconidia calcicola]|uniref:Uncharacterized protein n=1 Tax=Vermiconidia calcicola TaxID=1690605 RepID=A0ACC3MIE0_9PEZI|nr:hypothetical protein LTR37_018039 [Vermiconidia calcicola]
MAGGSWLPWFNVCIYSTFLGLTQGEFHELEDSHKYITRPDIEAPRWNLTIYNSDLISPGYWFVPSYDFLDQSLENGGKWTAPHIFDETGELIWSGSYLSQQYDIFDFRVSNVLGEDMLTMLYPKNRSALVLDTHYNIRKTVPIALGEEQVDMHEFHVVDNGTKALYFYDKVYNLTAEQSQAIGFTEWNCPIKDNYIRELDVTNDWETVFDWSLAEHVDLQESSKTANPVEDRCSKNWDLFHVNSLDKFPDGSYLMSVRHADTIYKVDKDGAIIWRLGGVKPDFEADFDFSRQHHARIKEHNETHTILSFFDNATPNPRKDATSDSSRGVVVSLQTSTQPMTATLLREYKHPDGPGTYTIGRANVQILPNGNAFICWVDALLQTEYSADGELVMEARVKQEWLKSYRSYKFPFVGRPVMPPDVYSETTGSDEDDSTTTLVYVSWNGATEVASWNMYKTDHEGNDAGAAPVATVPRAGFETTLKYQGYATYVRIEGLDRMGEVLGRSSVVQTVVSAKLSTETATKETEWLEEIGTKKTGSDKDSWTTKATYSNPAIIFISGITIGGLLILGIRVSRRRGLFLKRQGGASYELVNQREEGVSVSDKEQED